MGIERKEVEHIARLARLHLPEEEIKQFTVQLGEIVEYFAKLRELNIEGVEPTSHVEKMTNRMRKDKPGTSLSREEGMSNAPDASNGQYRVPIVIKDEGPVS